MPRQRHGKTDQGAAAPPPSGRALGARTSKAGACSAPGWGLGFRVSGLGFGVWGLGFRVYGLGFGVGVWGMGNGVWGLGFGLEPALRLVEVSVVWIFEWF